LRPLGETAGKRSKFGPASGSRLDYYHIKMHRNDQALLVALALAVASALLVWATIVAGAFAMPNDAGWIYNYQSLIGGIIALSGAAVGAWFLHKQIRQTTEIENERRERKRAALRAVGPIILSSVIQYEIPLRRSS
jgi:putative Mn2+ efflux pump MntP